jgi:RNA polymerase sigma-70 factor (ECF subfamily)
MNAAAPSPSVPSPDGLAGRCVSVNDLLSELAAHREQFLGFLVRQTGDRQLAEDLLQDAFLRGVDHLALLRQGESVVAWFYRVLRNVVIDQRRRLGARQRTLAAFAAEPAPATDPPRRACGCIVRLASNLRPAYSSALQRIEIEGVAVKDFAVEQGISSANAAARVFRARQALRRELESACGACAADGCSDCTCQDSFSLREPG